MTRMMRNVVEIQGGFKPSVQLPKDFFSEEYNKHFVDSYIPTHDTLDIFMHVQESLQMNSESRAKLFTGTYGTGKSDLMLMIANYITRSSDDPLLGPFFERLRRLNHSKADIIYKARLHKPPFLLVLLQADTATTFSSFVLDGLEKALAQIGQSDILGTTYYKAARELIARWEMELTDNIERVEKGLRETYGMTLQQLKRDLASSQADQALDIFRNITVKTFGMPFHPTAVIERPDDAFDSVSKKLVSSGKYSGIFVITDEFTHLLQNLAESSTTAPDIKAIDNLAETAARSGKNQIHFYVVSLQGFSSAQARTTSSQTALERTGGRFIQGQESLRSQYMEELISATIAKKVSPSSLFEKDTQQQDELLSLAMSLWGERYEHRDREWIRETIVYGCFPLHPLTAYCLPLLNSVLAQNERTMFSFLWDDNRGLKSFIDKANLKSDGAWLNLLSLDWLFTYFETSLKEKRPELFYLYQQSASKLSPEQVNTGLEGRFLKTLILLDIASGDLNLRANQELLRHALNLSHKQTPNINAALQQLAQAGIAYPNQAGYYQLVKQGQANPSELRSIIEKQAKTLLSSPLTILNSKYKLNDTNATNYNKKHGTDRKLTARFVSMADLSHTTSLTQELIQADGLLWYVITTTETERLQAQALAIQLTKSCDQLVIAIPVLPTDILERLKRKLAVEQIRNNPEYDKPNYQELLKDNGLVGSDYHLAFDKELRNFENCSTFAWHQQGRTTVVQTTSKLEELATQIMTTVFPNTPTHSIGQHLSKQPRNSTKLKEALDLLLGSPFNRAANASRKSITDAILINGAGELGLAYYKGHEGGYNIYDVCAPDKGPSKVVWHYLDDQLQKSGMSWSDIVAQLKCRPYGLYAPVIQLFLVTFLRLNRDYTEVYTLKNNLFSQSSPNQRIDVTGEVIIKMVENPKDYLISYKPLSKQQKDFLSGLENILLSNTEIHRRRTVEAASLRNQIAQFLYEQLRTISILSQIPSLNDLNNVAPGMPEETISIAQTLVEIVYQANEGARAVALLETLPLKLGLSVNPTEWTSTDIEQALSLTGKAYKLLLQLPSKLRQSIIIQISQWFGESTNNEKEAFNLVKRWRKEKTQGVHAVDLPNQKDALVLLKLLDDAPYSFEQVFLNALPSRLDLHVFDEWQTISTRKHFLDRLEQAIQVIEQKAASLLTVPGKSHIESPQSAQLSTEITAEKKMQTVTLQKNTMVSLSDIEQKPSFIENNISSHITQPAVVTPKDVDAQQKQADLQNNLTAQQKQADLQNNLRFDGTQEQRRETNSLEQNLPISVETAFQAVQAIINNLSPKVQHLLWAKLVEEYDPR